MGIEPGAPGSARQRGVKLAPCPPHRHIPPIMPRPRAFEERDVLDRAMAVFWRQGFEATSIQDLVEAAGINRASMYAAFGDKRGLFLAVIDHYLARVNAARLAILTAPGPAPAAIGRFFDSMIDMAGQDERQLGCLLTNTLIELAPRDPEIAMRLRASLDRIEEGFARTIRRGQDAGEIPPGKNPRALARFLVGIAQGLRVLARGGAGAAEMHEVAAIALGTLE